MALHDTDITVALLCPALVRSSMSNAGDDPADVAAAALAASRAGRFLVVSEEWADAVRLRAAHLLNGEVPVPQNHGLTGEGMVPSASPTSSAHESDPVATTASRDGCPCHRRSTRHAGPGRSGRRARRPSMDDA